jgi:alkanesulfonate monooxygenase SsuD/methylene tetrahydromethanopterin reductase-like flavin-dependent oxidoreductase (luciferase family)
MFPNPPGLLRLEPYSEGLRGRIWWGAGSSATAEWAAKIGMNLQSSTLVYDETGESLAVQQAGQIRKIPRGMGGGRAHAYAAGVGQPQAPRQQGCERAGIALTLHLTNRRRGAGLPYRPRLLPT